MGNILFIESILEYNAGKIKIDDRREISKQRSPELLLTQGF
ncbi:hypothetical protein ymoll0001_39750 [Yersinia mollaretii ATCC 43969]|uniref:Uncharacterized protein n=1 Tax=Yersinia mollaretii (strain ATCC 43969 / DSM 18520 / CIP 103324 / CNY 7263 / WAIP 204) TaxID=349967 RepID=A0ABP2ECE3_YERMW|nr:hypothetical protein ymoll0001_39750 [Yersinia mollaretii ATCC 43969]